MDLANKMQQAMFYSEIVQEVHLPTPAQQKVLTAFTSLFAQPSFCRRYMRYCYLTHSRAYGLVVKAVSLASNQTEASQTEEGQVPRSSSSFNDLTGSQYHSIRDLFLAKVWKKMSMASASMAWTRPNALPRRPAWGHVLHSDLHTICSHSARLLILGCSCAMAYTYWKQQ